jgi:hypothetical protein
MPYFGLDYEGGFTQAAQASPEPNPTPKEPNPAPLNPPSANAQASPFPNPPPPFNLHTISEPLPNPPSSTTNNQPSSPSKKDDSSEPKGKLKSVPKMVTPLGNEVSQLIMKKWMSGMTRRLETRSASKEKGANSASLNKITIRKPSKEDYDNVPTEKYVAGMPLLLWCELFVFHVG